MHGAKPAALPPSALVAGLQAQDLAATRDFYVRDLGLTLSEEEAHRLVVRVGGATLEFRQHDGPPVAAGDLQLTFECEDPEGLLQRLRALGVEVDARPGGAGSVRFVARDPDGRRVVFTARPNAPEPQ